jgi:hypothetical protein
VDYSISRPQLKGGPFILGPVLLSLADLPYRPWDALRLRFLKPPQRVGRCLYFRKQALQAELAGYWQSADFFWQQSLSALEPLFPDLTQWERLLNSGGKIRSATELRDAFVREYFWDQFCGLYNGYVQQGRELTSDSRAFVHLKYLRRIMGLGATGFGVAWDRLAPGFMAGVNAALARGDVDGAISLARAASTEVRGSSDFAVLLAKMIHSRLIRALSKGANDNEQRRDKKLLDSAVTEIGELLQKSPNCLTGYYAMAELLHVRSIRAAQLQLIGDALIDNRKALSYNPQHEGALANRPQLLEIFEHLRKSFAEIQESISRDPRAGLNAAGLQLRSQLSVAQGAALNAAPTPSEAAAGAAFAAAEKHAAESPGEDIKSAEQFGFHRPLQSSLPDKSRPMRPPFSFWLFSREELRLKIQVAVALLLVLSTATVYSIDAYRATARDRLYDQLSAAVDSGKTAAALDAAAAYLSRSAPLRGDRREAYVRRIYLSLTKQWAAAHAGVADPDTETRLRQFARLARSAQ